MADPFSYYNVLIAIVLGLAVANLLAGVARLMHARDRVAIYWPVIFWTLCSFIAVVQQWWSDYDLRHYPDLGFSGFFSALLGPVVLSLLCSLVLPASDSGNAIDLRTWYYENRRWFFGLVASLMPLSYAFEFFAKGTLYKGRNESYFLTVFFLLAMLGFLSSKPRVHALLPAAVALVTTFYIGLLFAKMGGSG
ncbi:MAG: hypothetical protein NVSMB31_08320 [Vulcanimicrobiaceae bacterium]